MRRLALALAAAGLVACASQAPREDAAVRVGIVGWPLDPADALHALASDTEDCLATRIAEVAPGVVVVRQREIRDALFPLLEPATQPGDEAQFAALLAREDVHDRLGDLGLRYLVAFAGGTVRGEWSGFVLCGAGYGGGGCLGFAWRGETTKVDAALWPVDGGPAPKREAAESGGTSVVPALGLPLPILARSGDEACRELGTRVARAIREPAPP